MPLARSTKLLLVLSISIAFFVTEISIGFKTKSLALVADAFHYLSELSWFRSGRKGRVLTGSRHWPDSIVSYTLAYVASRAQASGKRTAAFSYAFHRAEVLGAFFNAVFLLGLALSIFLQSIERFVNISEVDHPLYVLIVGAVGLTLNIFSALLVHEHHGQPHAPSPLETVLPLEPVSRPSSAAAEEDPHVLHNHLNRAADGTAEKQNLGLLAVLIHLLGDAVNNVGVMVSAVLIWRLHSHSRFYADPAMSLGISLVIFSSAIPLTIKTAKILLDATPPELNLKDVTADLLAVSGVSSLHDMHVWQLSDEIQLATLHVCVPPSTTLLDWEHISETLQQCFAAWGIAHVTIAPELDSPDDNGDGGKACEDGNECALDEVKPAGPRKRNVDNVEGEV